MPTLNSTGNTRRGLPSLISSGKVWKTSRGNGTSTVKWSLNAGREKKKKCKVKEIKWLNRNSRCFAMLQNLKLYCLTPETGLSKLQKERLMVCMHERKRQTAFQIDMEGGGARGVYHLITLGIKRTVASSNKLAWPCRGKCEVLLYCREGEGFSWSTSLQHSTLPCQTAVVWQHLWLREFLNKLFYYHVD